MMARLTFLLCFFFIASADVSLAQKQLLVMKRENVLLRLYPGDEITFQLKGSKRKRTSYVNNLSDTSVVIHRDTIPFNRIGRIYFKRLGFHNRLGAHLVVAGGLLFLIDQLNYVAIQGNEPSVDGSVSRASVAAIGLGSVLWLAKKKSRKIDGRVRLLTVDERSPFYRPDIRTRMDQY